MGRKVNVVLPSGRVVAVDEDVAKTGQLSSDGAATVLAGQETDRLNEERSSGVVEGLKAAGEGAADAATFGGYGAVRGVLDPEGARNMQIRAQERGGARMVGELGAMIAPGGMLGKTVGRAAEFTAPGLARAAGEAIGGGIKGQFLEGAIMGVGGYVSSTNVTGDPLTIEAAVESATIGGIIDAGFHAAANKFEGFAWRGLANDAKARQLRETLSVAEKGKKVFQDTPPSWNEFVDLHEARQKAVRTYNTQVAKEAKEYDEFWQNNHKLTTSISEVDNFLSELQQTGRKPFSGDTTRVKYTFDDAGKVRTAEYAYDDGAKAKAGFEGEGEGFVKGPNGEMLPVAGQPQIRAMQYDVDGRQALSPADLELVKEHKKRLSQMYQQKAGGYRMDKGKWIRDPSVPPDPKGALENLRALRAEVEAKWSKRAGEELGKTLKTQLPTPPRDLMPDVPGHLPRSIEDFSRKHAEQVAELANNLNDPQMASALERVMKDLDLLDPNVAKTPTQHLADLHGTLRTYRSKIGEMDEYAAVLKAKEEAEAARSPVLGWIKKAIRYTAGRAADTGGAWGAMRRQLGGSAAMRGMTAVEGAVLGYGASGGDPQGAALGAALMSGRLTMRERLRNLVVKHSANGAALARKLGSPLAYLSQSFPSGEKDTETDPRKQAINRIHELHSAAMVAPDAAFMAVQGMLGQPGDIGWKMHQHVVGTLNYLVSTLPRDPGTDTKLFQSNWTPAYHEAVAMAHRLEAVNDPLTAIARAIAGNSHPAATEALWAVYPAMMNELAQELSIAAPNLKNLTYEQASAYSNLFRTPLTGLQQPVVVTTLQGLYMKGSQATAPLPAGPAGGAPKKAPGRPAAVQSPVAGSNVASHTS